MREAPIIKNPLLRHYWIELEASPDCWPEGTVSFRSFGITAFTPDDALFVLSRYFPHRVLPPICPFVDGVDMTTLDPHVSTNAAFWLWRGVWFPQFMPLVR